jgi:DNA-binding HxlR family transcriptional regulator
VTNQPAPKRHPYNQWAPDARALDIVGDKWTLLIVRDLASGPRRFVELGRVLPGISTEQLRARLVRMVAEGLLTRRRYREAPPRVDYALTARSRDLLPVIAALVRWGRDWEWTPPRDLETIDIGAILRAAPGLVYPCAEVTAVAEFTVDVDATTARCYTLTGDDGFMSIEERRAAHADVRVRGPQSAWIDALGPRTDSSGLQIDGDELLAALLLGELGGAARRRDPLRRIA